MTPEQCRAKRNEFNAMARRAIKEGNPALASWCDLMGKNMLLMASDDPAKRARGQAAYEKNKFRFERDMARS
jgi:hypothetical protein